jgi:hypothetical protein
MTARLPIILDANTRITIPHPPDTVPALIAAAGERDATTLSFRNFAHPFNWKIEGRRLLFDPLACFIERGAELRCRRATREAFVRVGDSTFTDKSATNSSAPSGLIQPRRLP